MQTRKFLRIGQFLSRSGICSRREAKEFLQAHTIVFQKQVIQDLNFKLPEDAIIYVDGKKVSLPKEKIIVLLNKPAGYVCSHREQKGQKSIFRLLPKEWSHLFFAGRLDENSRGLVVLSNDGDLIYKLSHPSQKVKKEYLVKINRPLSEIEKTKLLKGVYDHGEKLRALDIEEIRPAYYRIFLQEGKKRQLRRMFSQLGLTVLDLQRISVGEFRLGNLAEGNYELLTTPSNEYTPQDNR